MFIPFLAEILSSSMASLQSALLLIETITSTLSSTFPLTSYWIVLLLYLNSVYVNFSWDCSFVGRDFSSLLRSCKCFSLFRHSSRGPQEVLLPMLVCCPASSNCYRGFWTPLFPPVGNYEGNLRMTLAGPRPFPARFANDSVTPWVDKCCVALSVRGNSL